MRIKNFFGVFLTAFIAGALGAWTLVIFFGGTKEPSATLTGLVTIVLTCLAIILALSAVLLVIWGKDWLDNLVKQRIKQESEYTHKELVGRVKGFVGFIFGNLTEQNPRFIDLAIDWTHQALRELPDKSEFELKAKNNLSFYYAKRGYTTDASEAVKYAAVLKEAYGQTKDVDLLTTYGFVVSKYYRDFNSPRLELLERTQKEMDELMKRNDVNPATKSSAERNYNALRSALELESPKPTLETQKPEGKQDAKNQ